MGDYRDQGDQSRERKEYEAWGDSEGLERPKRPEETH